MIKRSTKIITSVIFSLVLGVGATAYANTNPIHNNKADSSTQEMKNKDHRHGGRCGSMFKAMERLGITKEEMKKTKESGKTIFDLAKEKGISQDKVRATIIEEKNKCIDEAVKKGKMTKEKGEEIKCKIKTKMEKWDGTFRHKKTEG